MDESSTDNLTPIQEQALEALLVSTSIKAAAKRARCSDRALRNWLKTDPAFIAAYRAARKLATEVGVGKMQAAVGKAVKVLIAELKGEKGSDRIRAALGIIEGATGGIDWDVVARLEELESLMKEIKAANEQDQQPKT